MAKNTLVESFIDLHPGLSHADIINHINMTTGTNYNSRRLSDWLNGHRDVPETAKTFMQDKVLRSLTSDNDFIYFKKALGI